MILFDEVIDFCKNLNCNQKALEIAHKVKINLVKTLFVWIQRKGGI